MKSLNEYREQFNVEGSFSSTDLIFKRINNLLSFENKIDLDVYLPSIDMNLQRPYVWTTHQEEQLIISILVGREIPPIKYVSLICEGEGDIYQIIDGKQRLTAIIRFLKNKFPVNIEGKDLFYNDLPNDYKNEIDRYNIRGQALYEQYDNNSKIITISDETKVKWFNLINFAGTPQDKKYYDNLSYKINKNKKTQSSKKKDNNMIWPTY